MLWASEPPSPVGLALNGGPTLYVYGLTLLPLTGPTSVPFTFGNKLSPGASYSVTVVSNPSGLECSVTAGGTGNVSNANVTNVEITCVFPRPAYRLMFATTNTHNGNFGATAADAIAGADQFCATDPGNPNNGYPFKAMLVNTARRACSTASCGGGPSEHLDWVLAPNTEYRRTDGTTVIGNTNADAIFSWGLVNSIGPAMSAWTGMLPDWRTGSHCMDWTTDNNVSTGHRGLILATTSDAISFFMPNSCVIDYRVYCVEQ